jgi:subtilase family serine protease
LYFASSGDQGGVVEYPAASPFVISVGGTKVTRDTNNKILSEVGWDYTGGGFSIPEIRPPFQNPPLENVHGTTGRVTPDIAGPAGIDRLLDNGSPIYAGTTCSGNPPGWYAVGGTSLATPIIAAAASLDFPHGAKTDTVLRNIYAARKTATAIRDITFGRAGNNFVRTGYDAVTGVGVPASLQFALPPAVP